MTDPMQHLREIIGPGFEDRLSAIEAAAERAATRPGRQLALNPPPQCEACQDYYWMSAAWGKVVECEECLRRRAAERLGRAQATAGVSELHRACTLENYEPATRHAQQALDLARYYVDGWDQVRRHGRGIYLWGPVGTDKTHLAYGVVNALLEQGVTALVVREVDLFAESAARYGPDEGRAVEAERLIKATRTTDLLLVDDIGAAKWTESREEARYTILDRRMSESLPTVITSNHHPDHLINMIGERMVSRLHAMCWILPVTGPDHRRPADPRRSRG